MLMKPTHRLRTVHWMLKTLVSMFGSKFHTDVEGSDHKRMMNAFTAGNHTSSMSESSVHQN